jgi:hypothetical protein
MAIMSLHKCQDFNIKIKWVFFFWKYIFNWIKRGYKLCYTFSHTVTHMSYSTVCSRKHIVLAEIFRELKSPKIPTKPVFIIFIPLSCLMLNQFDFHSSCFWRLFKLFSYCTKISCIRTWYYHQFRQHIMKYNSDVHFHLWNITLICNVIPFIPFSQPFEINLKEAICISYSYICD